MDLRIGYSTILTLIAAALALCVVKGFTSPKKIGKVVGSLELAIILPITGSLLIIGASERSNAVLGSYIFFIGMDLVMCSLVRFANDYCTGIGDGTHKPTFVYMILGGDIIQLLLNPFFGHAFDVKKVDVHGIPYFQVEPYIGQTIHRIVDCFVLLCVILIFILATFKTAKIYRERFSLILVTLIIAGGWEVFYIIFRKPFDTSMIGFGIFGIMVFYFAIYYRPLRLLDRMLSNIAANMNDGLYVYDPYGKCIWANQKGLKIAGVDEKELDEIPVSLRRRFGEREFTQDDWSMNRVIGSGADAEYYTIENHPVNDENRHYAGSYLIIRDNTEEQKRLQQEIYSSTHDSLTGLYTKQYFYDCVKTRLAENTGIEYLAVFVDVKNFKIVNDVFSTEFGDAALIQIANWIRSNMSASCVYGRLAGDTFGAIIPSHQFRSGKAELELSSFIVRHNNAEHRLLIHLGIYKVENKDMDVSVMFDRAHLALSSITEEYKTHIAYYDNELREKVLREQRISSMLGEAINTMQIIPYLQPITDTEGKIVGAEALARWQHPEHGFMSPAMFIPVFEKNGMIVELDRHMWRCACEILAGWKGVHDDLFISVNISPKDFYFIDVVSEIKGLAKVYDIEPRKLRIEITETVMMTEPEEKMKLMEELRSAGFIVEMDDFGSGYSSLSLLKDMPVDVLKIDMKFLASSVRKEKAKTVVRNIIRLSEELGISSLTEGVETHQQFTILSEMGCKLFQGYFFAMPMPKDEFEVFAFGNG